MADTENYNSHREPLDGTGNIKPVPFDAHEQIARVPHEEVPNAPGYAHSGLRPLQPEAEVPQAVEVEQAEVQEFLKAVDHVQKPDAPEGHLEPVIATDAEHEAELKAATTQADKAPAI